MALKNIANLVNRQEFRDDSQPSYQAVATLSVQPVKRGVKGQETTTYVAKRVYTVRDIAKVAANCDKCKLEFPVVLEIRCSAPVGTDLAVYKTALDSMVAKLGTLGSSALLNAPQL